MGSSYEETLSDPVSRWQDGAGRVHTILHRKNALFYKTQNGAQVGDTYMSLIYTAELCGANPFDYLTELQRHAQRVRSAPQQWMPWNYRATLAELDTPTSDDPPSDPATRLPEVHDSRTLTMIVMSV